MRESCTYGVVRGALSNERPYRDHCFIWRESMIVITASSRRAAVRRFRFARFRAIGTKPLVMRVPSLGPRPSSNQGASAKRSRCGSHT